MTLAADALTLLVGCLIGVLGGMLGIGGGLIAIPTLGLLFGLTEQLAQGTALIMVVSNVTLGLRKYHLKKKLEWKTGLILSATSIPTNLICSYYATQLSSALLRRAFALFLLVLAVEAFRSAYVTKKSNAFQGNIDYGISLKWTIVLGLVAGCLGGLFGIGGGLFAVIMLTLLFGYPQMIAQGISLISVLPSAIINLLIYNHAGDIQWHTGAILALGGCLTIPLGVNIALALRDQSLKFFFAGLAGLSSLGLFIH